MFGFIRRASTDGLDIIDRALERAKAPVRFWWRDDDAGAHSAALERLLSLSQQNRAPVSVAVIPARMETRMIEAMRGRDFDVLVHGYAHNNQAGEGQPKCEFPLSRPLEDMRADLRKALSLLREALPQNTIPVFVPPWNRFPDKLLPLLKECGYVGLSKASTMKPDPAARENGLRQFDGHFNVVAWKDGPHLADMPLVSKKLAKQIRAGAQGPFSIVTHHRDHDEAIWAYCEKLWKLLGTHRNAHIVRAREIFI